MAISAGPATEAASPPAKKAVVRDTNQKKLPPGETTGQEVPPKAPRKRGGSRYKKKQHLERPEVVEADSFLPAEWVKEIEDGVEDYQRQEAEAVIAKLERQALRKLKAMSRPNTEKQSSAQAKEKVYAVRRLHAAQAAHRIIDGALKEGRELKQLVDEAKSVPLSLLLVRRPAWLTVLLPPRTARGSRRTRPSKDSTSTIPTPSARSGRTSSGTRTLRTI